MNKQRIAAGALSAMLLAAPVLAAPVSAVQVHAATPGITFSAPTTSSVTVTVDGLNIRKSASANSSITGSLDEGAVIKIVETKKDSRGNTWGRLDSGKGWVNLKYTSSAKTQSSDSGESTSAYSVKVNCRLNVRSGAGSSYDIINTLKTGAVVKIDQTKKDSRGNKWGRIAGSTGWVNLKYTSTTTGDSNTAGTQNQSGTAASYTVKVTTDLNVRSGVGTGNSVVTTLSKNTKVSIVEEKKDSRGNTWGKLSDGKGWINLKYTTKTTQQTSQQAAQQQSSQSTSYNVKVSCDLNVRSGAGTGNSIVKTLSKNAKVTIVEEKKDSRGNTWGKLSDGRGWINLKYTAKTTAQAGTQTQQTAQQGGRQQNSVSYTVKITSGGLYVRKEASSSSDISATLHQGDKVTIVEEVKYGDRAVWGKLSDGRGWISLKYTEKA